MIYRIFFTNFGYAHEKEFESLSEAVDFGKKKGFEFAAQKKLSENEWETVAYWSLFRGLITV